MRGASFGISRPCSLLVQELLIATRDLALPRLMKCLSRFDALITDNLGYVEQSREEMEVLFTLLAQRYERGSVLLTSNLRFSKWEQIFKNPMTTAAAIDRLVHHSVLLELNLRVIAWRRPKSNTLYRPANQRGSVKGEDVAGPEQASTLGREALYFQGCLYRYALPVTFWGPGWAGGSQHRVERIEQPLLRKRLANVSVETRGKKALTVAGPRVGRTRHRRRRRVGRHLAQGAQQLDAGTWLAQVDVQKK